MVVQLSYRKSLRWIPGEPSEPTSTLVLDVGNYFVDLRILKATSSIDWAMAGKRTILSSSPLKCQWSKEICSQNTEAHDDIGEFEDLPDGDALEKGSMPNPDNNDEVQAYEEVWGSIEVKSSNQPAWILRSKDGNGITYVGKVGDWFQVLRKKEDGSFSVLREERASGKWVKRYAIGEELPSMATSGEQAFSPEGWQQDMDVQVQEVTYTVYALEKV
ncbi:hypothetical protein KCU73_g2422, partial [Aureobasidium melanogenum]